MSMNGFFKAFTLDDCNAMLKDHSLIDKWVWEEKRSIASTDVASAWHLLQHVLGYAGFSFDVHVEKALSTGCFFISPRKAIEHSTTLSAWSHERIISALDGLGTDDIYHLEAFTDDEDGQGELLEQFDRMVAFYAGAAERRNGVIFYIA